MKRLLLGVILLPCIAHGSTKKEFDERTRNEAQRLQAAIDQSGAGNQRTVMYVLPQAAVFTKVQDLEERVNALGRLPQTVDTLIEQAGVVKRADKERMDRMQDRIESLEWRQNTVLKLSFTAVTIGGILVYLRNRNR